MTNIVIHPATISYSDFGSYLTTVCGIRLEVNGVLMAFERGKSAADELASWQKEISAHADHFRVTVGGHVGSSCDINPLGTV